MGRTRIGNDVNVHFHCVDGDCDREGREPVKGVWDELPSANETYLYSVFMTSRRPYRCSKSAMFELLEGCDDITWTYGRSGSLRSLYETSLPLFPNS